MSASHDHAAPCSSLLVSSVVFLSPTWMDFLFCNGHDSHMQIVLCLQVQEEGFVLPDALVWQVLWEVAQVRPLACC